MATEQQVLDLRRAGAGFDQIKEALGITDEEARTLYVAAIANGDHGFDSDLEVERLDKMLLGVWTKASRGDLSAVDRVIKISERREKLTGPPKANDHAFRLAFDATVEACKVADVDLALIEAGRKIADRVDAATATGEGQEVTKALYLVPHMMNILREMLATPAARAGLEQVVVEAKSGGRLASVSNIPRPGA